MQSHAGRSCKCDKKHEKYSYLKNIITLFVVN